MWGKNVLMRGRAWLSTVNLNFRVNDKLIKCEGVVGDTLLRVGLENNIPLDGACGGCQACSTCHIYIEPEYLSLIAMADEKEEDILDMVDDLEDNSRLACAIKITKELDGIIMTLPESTTNLQE